jgi:hypothetical protein
MKNCCGKTKKFVWNSFQEGQKDVLLSIRTFSILSTIAFFPSAVYKNSISRYLVCMFHTIRQIFFWIFINVEKHREKWQNVFLIGKKTRLAVKCI